MTMIIVIMTAMLNPTVAGSHGFERGAGGLVEHHPNSEQDLFDVHVPGEPSGKA